MAISRVQNRVPIEVFRAYSTGGWANTLDRVDPIPRMPSISRSSLIILPRAVGSVFPRRGLNDFWRVPLGGARS